MLLKQPFLFIILFFGMIGMWWISPKSPGFEQLHFTQGALFDVLNIPTWLMGRSISYFLDLCSAVFFIWYLFQSEMVAEKWGWYLTQFCLAIFAFPLWLAPGAHHWILFLFLVTWLQIRGLGNEKKQIVRGYDTGFILGLLPLILPSFWFLSIIVLMSAAILGTLRFRTVFLFLLGLLSPAFLLLSLTFIYQPDLMVYRWWTDLFFYFPNWSHFQQQQGLLLELMLVITGLISFIPLERGALVF
jgi:hypothetical protein